MKRGPYLWTDLRKDISRKFLSKSKLDSRHYEQCQICLKGVMDKSVFSFHLKHHLVYITLFFWTDNYKL